MPNSERDCKPIEIQNFVFFDQIEFAVKQQEEDDDNRIWGIL